MKAVFVFPGQGAQYAGMAREAMQHAVIRATYEEASEAIGVNLLKLCTDPGCTRLHSTELAQPALLTAGVSLFRWLESETGLRAAAMAGHSLGEYTALACAGAISLEQAVQLVHHRGLFMAECVQQTPGVMAAVIGAEMADVEGICASESSMREPVTISAYNCSSELVISGAQQAVQRAGQQLTALGASLVPLKVAGAFHSPLMAAAAVGLEAYIDREVSFAPIQLPVCSNVTADFHTNDHIGELLVRQLTAPVRWLEVMNKLVHYGVDTVIELGPRQTLNKLFARSHPEVKGYSTDTAAQMRALLSEFGRAQAAPDMAPQPAAFLNRALVHAVATRNRNPHYKQHEQEAARAFMQLRELQSRAYELAQHDLDIAYGLLQAIMTYKQVPADEQQERSRELQQLTLTNQRLF